MDEEYRTVWVGNLDSDRISEDILFELFLQAGPVQVVRVPKDKTTGKMKSFAFVIYRDEVSVAYAIALLNGIPLFRRAMRVQCRKLEDLRKQGIDIRPKGIHTLDPDMQDTANNAPGCGQQSLMGSPMHVRSVPQFLMGGQPHIGGQSHMGGHSFMTDQSLMGGPPASLMGNSPCHFSSPQFLMNCGASGRGPQGAGGQTPVHILEMAKKMALISQQQPVPLSDNPFLNAPGMQRNDRFGSLNQETSNSSHRDSRRTQSYPSDHSRGPRSVDHETMKAFKSKFDREAEKDVTHNSDKFENRTGHFDYSRLGGASKNSSVRQRDNSDYNRYNDNDRSNWHSRYDNRSQSDNRFQDDRHRGSHSYDRHNRNRNNNTGYQGHDNRSYGRRY